MIRKLFALSAIVFLLPCGRAFCQESIIKQVSSVFDKHLRSTYPEKAFLHLDKGFYVAGELMWFKAYVTSASDGRLSDLSKVLYVELSGEAGQSIIQTKLALSEGAGHGSLFLPVSINSGNYVLRAYTNWMKNSGSHVFFEKRITILNTFSAEFTQARNSSDYDIQFFPEGGSLLAGTENRVAFRVVGADGYGVRFKGTLVSADGQPVSTFQPLKSGIGSFVFTPRAGERYRVIVEVENHPSKIEIPFVPVTTAGYSMRVQSAMNSILSVNLHGPAAATGLFYLFVHDRKQVILTEQKTMVGDSVSFTIDQGKLGDGISRITVFDAGLRPVAERLFFKRPSKQFMINVKPDRPVYGMRESVALSLHTVQSGQPKSANLSVSVRRFDDYQGGQADIFQHEWLTSELRGNIEDPAYYFERENEETNEALDNLMLTHGWRRFRWEDVLKATKTGEYLPEFEGHIVQGKIVDRNTSRPAPGILTFLSVPSKRVQMYSSRSDAEGRVRFFTREFRGPGDIVVQTDFMRDSLYRFELENPFSPIRPDIQFSALSGSQVPAGSIDSYHLAAQVQNAYHAGQLTVFNHPLINRLPFYGKAEYSYRLSDFVRFKTTEEVLREYIPSVVLFRQRDNFNMVVDKKTAKGPVGSVPLILLDGVPIFDRGNKIIAYDPDKLERIDILTGNSFIGDTTFNSIASFFSVKGNLEAFQPDERAYIGKYDGLQLEREFFSPVYETPAQKSSRLPDLRQVLYWSPNAGTDETGQKILYFYTGDESGEYVIDVQGLSSDGKSGSASATFTIK